MDNNLQQLIHDQVHHAIDEAVGSPAAINRVVGEAMRHIGANLVNTASGYLPIRMEEFLAEPMVFEATGKKAVIMLNRSLNDRNSFQIVASIKQVGEELEFSVIAFQPDTFEMNKTRFLNLPEDLRNEVIRQLGMLCKKEGMINLQCIVFDDYFKVEADTDNLLNSDLRDPTPAPVEKQPAPAVPVVRGLPPVKETSELL